MVRIHVGFQSGRVRNVTLPLMAVRTFILKDYPQVIEHSYDK